MLFAFTLFRNDNVIQASRLSDATIKSIKAASVDELYHPQIPYKTLATPVSTK